MLLRRITQHVKDQNWFAVAVDFVIVVIGVLPRFESLQVLARHAFPEISFGNISKSDEKEANEELALGIFSAPYAYIVGFEGMADEEAHPLLKELGEWQSQEQFVYRHKWQNNMLVMWDNRSVLHKATGGYEGYRRELHRITINSNASELAASAP